MSTKLGKGLGALMYASAIEVEASLLRSIPISQIEPDATQPRSTFDTEKLGTLAESIKLHGVLQPLLVSALPDGRFRIVAGERRWRAARMAGLDEIPVQVVELPPQAALEVALVENLQREDLNPMELSVGFRRLIDEFGLTQEEVAARVGKSRSAVANSLRLLQLPKPIQALVREGQLSEGHARTLVGLPEPLAADFARQAITKPLSVRQLERMVASIGQSGAPPEESSTVRTAHIDSIASDLSSQLGRRVTLSVSAKKGKLEIEFYDDTDLEALVEQLGLHLPR